MKKTALTLLALGVLVLASIVSYKLAALKYRSEITVLKGDVAIYKSQAEKYAGLLRKIRETATSATVVEKAP